MGNLPRSRLATLVLIFVITAFYTTVGLAAEQVTVFGPETFVRERGAPEAVARTFSPSAHTGEFTLVVDNGEAGRIGSRAPWSRSTASPYWGPAISTGGWRVLRGP